MPAVLTHCITDDPLSNGELRANLSFPGGIAPLVPGGSKRGVVIFCHGLGTGPQSLPVPLSGTSVTLANDLVADGWVVLAPAELGDSYTGQIQSNGIVNDFTNDAGHGSRWQNNNGLWLDGGLVYVNEEFGNWPIVMIGISWGGLLALQAATKRTSSITAYCAHVAAMLPWTINGVTAFQGAPNLNFTLASSMNGLTLPQTSLTVNEVITSALAGPGSLVVASSVTAQVVTYTSVNTATKTFNGLTGGNTAFGTMATGGAVVQSSFSSGCDIPFTALNALGNGQQGSPPLGFIGWETADFIVGYSNQQLLYGTASGAGAPVTSLAGTGPHGLSASDVTAIMAWITGPVDAICPAVH